MRKEISRKDFSVESHSKGYGRVEQPTEIIDTSSKPSRSVSGRCLGMEQTIEALYTQGM
jgi:hypothetical protein